MPLFRRSDADLCRELSPVRRMVPYIMRTRTESVVYYEQRLSLEKTLPFIARWNAENPQKVTLFHVVLGALGRVLHERPGLNRFVSGGRIYARRGVFVSFAAKKAFEDQAPLLTVKLPMPAGQPFAALVESVHAAVGGARTGPERAVDQEVRLALKLPHPLLRAALALLRVLDRWNLMPRKLLEPDPMYASLFVANLGSVGLDAAWHHLYEYGTVSVFAALGAIHKEVVADERGLPAVRDTAVLRYTFDERINDGFYCARALELVREYVESPERLLGP